MTKTYELLELAKAKTKIESDYGISQLLEIDRQMISGWKRGKSEASAINTLKLIKAAGLTVDDALELMTKSPIQKELELNVKPRLAMTGFIDMSLLFVTALLANLGLALTTIHGICILCKIK